VYLGVAYKTNLLHVLRLHCDGLVGGFISGTSLL